MGRSFLCRSSGCVLALLWACPAWGEPPSEAINMARKRFQEGVAAIDAGNYEAARVAFQQAYTLKPHPSVLRNLGQAELKVGHYLEAARHLAIFVRDTTFGAPGDRESAQKALAEAEAKIGKLVLEVDVSGANVTVDGETVGRSPLGPDPVYVESGQRIVRIEKEGYESYEWAQGFEAGRTTQMRIVLRGAGPRPTQAASVSRLNGSLAASTADAPVEKVGSPPPDVEPRRDSKIPLRTVALVATGGLTVVSAGVWIGFALQGASLESEADDLKAGLDPVRGCTGASAICEELRDVSHRRANANTIAIIGGVATGVSAAAFAGVLLFWRKPPTTSVAFPSLVPMVSSDRAGLALAGAF